VQPSLGAPVKGLARSFKAMNDIEGLKQALDTLIETDQADFIAYLASAKILASQGRQAEGLALLKQGLKHHSNIPANHLIFANYQIELGQVKNAISTYRDTIKAFPEELNIQHLLASLLIRQANYQEAANLYVGILEKKPDDVTAANNLASLYSEQLYSEDNIRKARQLSQIFAQSSNPAFQDTYAWILVKSGQADQALPTLQAIVDSHPDVSLFRYHLGIALTKAERFTEGQQVLNKAFELIQRSGEDPELVKLIEKELLIEKEHLIEKELL
jgi:predicted Zn-dependent protease